MTPRYKTSWAKEETMEGVEVERFLARGLPGFRLVSELAHSLWPFISIPRAIKKMRPDVVHMHYFLFTGHAAYRASKRLGIPTVLTLVGNDVYDPFHIPGGFLKFFNERIVRGSDRVVAACAFIRKVVSEKFARPLGKINVIPYGVDADRFSPGTSSKENRRSFGIPDGKKVVLTVQRLHERKEIPVFLKAAQLVLESRKDVFFLIAGKGPEEKALKNLSVEMGLSDRIKFLGFVPDERLPVLYQVADIFAFHTIHEGFGIVVLEAMACGKPVVTTRAGGTEDIVEDGKTGFLVSPRDPESFSECIIALLGDGKLASSFGRAGRISVENKFSWPRVTDSYETIYNDLKGRTHT
jgi:glycosyltransferase involved in cell wall biosynthesis